MAQVSMLDTFQYPTQSICQQYIKQIIQHIMWDLKQQEFN